jgi:hypothetical protein
VSRGRALLSQPKVRKILYTTLDATSRAVEQRLRADIIELALRYGRYGYRKVAAPLRQAGWIINDKRVERSWHPP